MHLFLFTNSAQRELVSPLMNPNQIKFSKVEKVVNKYIDNFQTAMFPRLSRFMWISGKDTWFSQLLLSIWNMYFFYSSFCRAALCWWILFQYSLLLCDMQITQQYTVLLFLFSSTPILNFGQINFLWFFLCGRPFTLTSLYRLSWRMYCM